MNKTVCPAEGCGPLTEESLREAIAAAPERPRTLFVGERTAFAAKRIVCGIGPNGETGPLYRALDIFESRRLAPDYWGVG